MIPSIDFTIEDGDQIGIIVKLASEGGIETVTLGVIHNPWMIPAVTLRIEDDFIVVIAGWLTSLLLWLLRSLWLWSGHGSRLHLGRLGHLSCISSSLVVWHGHGCSAVTIAVGISSVTIAV